MPLDLTGRDVPAAELRDGRGWIVEPLDITSSIVYRRRGDIRLGGWLRSFRGVREGAWFARDDPIPFLALWPRLATDRIAGLTRRRCPASPKLVSHTAPVSASPPPRPASSTRP